MLFDTTINSSLPDIVYSAGIGTFFINKSEKYYVSWWVNTDAAQAETSVVFGIRIISGGISTIHANLTSIQVFKNRYDNNRALCDNLC